MSEGWRAAVDERLIARCHAHEARGARLTRDWSMPERAQPPRTHLDPADWRTGFLDARREREIPPALQADIHENMPQALLRDLYRPVHEERWIAREPIEGTGDRSGAATMTEARAARRVPALPRIEPGARAVVEYLAWRRALLAERWQPPPK
ncbi:MAG TPA: hypothetical protein VGL86_33400 [Polyangia bacterium]|jgi:hypothetical protein